MTHSLVVFCENAAMEEERRISRQRCVELQSAVRSANISSSQLNAELASCRGQLSAVQCRLEHVEAVHETTSRRDAELHAANAQLRHDLQRAQQQVSTLYSTSRN